MNSENETHCQNKRVSLVTAIVMSSDQVLIMSLFYYRTIDTMKKKRYIPCHENVHRVTDTGLIIG